MLGWFPADSITPTTRPKQTAKLHCFLAQKSPKWPRRAPETTSKPHRDAPRGWRFPKTADMWAALTCAVQTHLALCHSDPVPDKVQRRKLSKTGTWNTHAKYYAFAVYLSSFMKIGAVCTLFGGLFWVRFQLMSYLLPLRSRRYPESRPKAQKRR